MSGYPDPDTWRQLEVDATTPDGIEFYDEADCPHRLRRELTPRTAYCRQCGSVVPVPPIVRRLRDPEIEQTMFVDLCTPDEEAPMF